MRATSSTQFVRVNTRATENAGMENVRRSTRGGSTMGRIDRHPITYFLLTQYKPSMINRK